MLLGVACTSILLRGAVGTGRSSWRGLGLLVITTKIRSPWGLLKGLVLGLNVLLLSKWAAGAVGRVGLIVSHGSSGRWISRIGLEVWRRSS